MTEINVFLLLFFFDKENVSIQEMNISRNSIGDYGAIVISKALGE